MILAAGSVAYLGVFTADFRKDLMQNWINKFNDIGINVDQKFNITRVMGDPVEMRQWQICNQL